MKTIQHRHQQGPLILATTRQVAVKDSVSDDPVIRLKLDHPPHWDWQLTTTADDLPVIQLLDGEGRVLVETTGRVAQRARGTFRDGLKSHESFPEPVKEESPQPSPPATPASAPAKVSCATGNRNYEGFSTKYGPLFGGSGTAGGGGFRKSSSEATSSSSSQQQQQQRRAKEQQQRKRHSANESELEKGRKEAATKRYSAGDYLRQQILEDLASRANGTHPADEEEETLSEVARNRYKKIKAYFRSQSDGGAQRNALTDKSSTSSSSASSAGKKRAKSRESPVLAGKRLTDADLDRIRRFLQDKIDAKMRQDGLLQRTLSVPVQSSGTEEQPIADKRDKRKRHSSSPKSDESKPNGAGVLKNYRARKIRSDANIRFAPDETFKNNNKSEQPKVVKRDCSGFEKRKVYRKTKSDMLLGHLSGSSFGSEMDRPSSGSSYPTSRIKSQDNFDRSWREYKERKRLERLRREMNLGEEDFMTRPRWKDFQKTCDMRNCKVCENMRSCVDPMKPRRSESLDSLPRDRPPTSLQENYLMLDPPRCSSEEPSPKYGKSSPDFGYNSISKRGRKNSREDEFAKSNVRKTDTFKIVDGGEEEEDEADGGEVCYDYSNKTNEEIAKDYFKRVYELLRRRQEEAKLDELCEDTSSSNCPPDDEELTKKRRRRRKIAEKNNEGEDPILGRRGVNGSLSSGCRVRVADQGGSSLAKRPRHPPPPTPTSSASSANKENKEPPSPSPLKQQRSDDYNSYQDDAGSEQQQLKAVEEPWEQEQDQEEPREVDMGSNLSRHHGHAKSLNGRRAHSSGNICDGRTINVGKFIVPCSKTSRERYKFCGSLPNHLDGKDVCSSLDNGNDDDPRSENNNVITDTICGNLGGTLPHKRSSGHRHAHANSEILYADDSPIIPSTKHHRSDESLDGDPWKYRQEGADLARCRYIESLRRSRGSDAGCPHQHQHHQHQHGHQHEWRRNSSTLSRGSRCHRSAELEVASTSTLPKRRQDSTKRSAPSLGELGDGPTRASRISIDKIDDDLLLKMVRHSSCKAKPNTGDQAPQSNGKGPPSNHHHHRQPGSGKCVDLKLYKLSASGEPLDQGYASERSPEDEHPPSLPGQPFPNIKPGEQKTRVKRIVGGFAVDRGQIPYSVSIRIINKAAIPHYVTRWADLSKVHYHICGGSIITHEWVLGAAFCFRQSYFKFKAQDIGVVAGYVLNTDWGKIRAANKRNVARLVIHKLWNVDERREHNIALLKMSKPWVYSKEINVIPISLKKLPVNSSCLVAGFGETNRTDLDYNLKLYAMKVVITPDCGRAYQWATKFGQGEMCIGTYQKDKGICFRDWGSGAVCNNLLHGIASIFVERPDLDSMSGVSGDIHADYCANEWPDIYTDITEYLDFINEYTHLWPRLNETTTPRSNITLWPTKKPWPCCTDKIRWSPLLSGSEKLRSRASLSLYLVGCYILGIHITSLVF